MTQPEYKITQKVFSTIYSDLEKGVVEDIIYCTPDMGTIMYGVIWDDGTYRREPAWRLSDYKCVKRTFY